MGTNFGARNVYWWDPALRNPYVINWNFSVQREFASDYLLDFSYQGSGGVSLLERWEANTFPIDFAVNDLTLRSQVLGRSQNYRPFSKMGNLMLQSNFGHSTFHSGTVKLEKRMSRGMYLHNFLHLLESD